MENQNNQLSINEMGEESSKIFPQRLMELLNEPSNHDAIIWLPHGKAFLIIDRQKFSTKVLPKYFRKTKYASFTRKLNRWNFSRITQGQDLGTYYHEFFQRGQEALCIQMYCKNKRFKYATSQDEYSTNIQGQDYFNISSPAITLSNAQHSSNIESQSLVSQIQAQIPQIEPTTGISTQMFSLMFPKVLPHTMIDSTMRIKVLIARQQAQIQQEQLKLSLMNASNPLLTSEFYPQCQSTTQEQISQKVAIIEMQLQAIRMKMKQDQLQAQPQNCSFLRQTSATAA